MKNTFVNNVAAGCVHRGYWIELKDKYQKQYHGFNGNSVHSSAHGLITYQRGWLTKEPAVIQNFVSFKNLDGAKFHITGILIFKEALFADNLIGIRYGAWNSGITFEDSVFMLSRATSHHVGAEVTFNNDPRLHKNVVFKNTVFRNYGRGSMTLKFKSNSQMENDMGDPAHLYGVTLENCHEDSVPRLGECGYEYRNFFMEDFDGTLAPTNMGSGFYLRDHELTKAFLPDDSCTPMETSKTGCLAYCEGVCLRLVYLSP